MKMVRFSVFVGIFTMVLVFLAVLTAHAQPDFAMWSGKWFALTIKYKGCAFEIPKIIPDRTKQLVYLHLGTWDRGALTFPAADTFVRVYDNGSGWIDVPLTVNVHGGFEFDFLCWVSEQNPPDMSYAFTLRVRGKEDLQNPEQVKTATLKSLGGCYWEKDGSDHYAGSMSLKGKMIDPSQVPVP